MGTEPRGSLLFYSWLLVSVREELMRGFPLPRAQDL